MKTSPLPVKGCQLTARHDGWNLNMSVWNFICVLFFITLERIFHSYGKSPLIMKVFSESFLSFHGHWAVKILLCATFTVIQDIRLYGSLPWHSHLLLSVYNDCHSMFWYALVFYKKAKSDIIKANGWHYFTLNSMKRTAYNNILRI